jgi:hypothetical protein
MRPRITGWKQRRDLGLVVLNGWSWAGVSSLSRALAAARINIPFLLLQEAEGRVEGGLALARDESRQAKDAARRLALDKGWPPPLLIEPVSALVLYPLSGGLDLPAEALTTLAGAGLAPAAMGTSPAALTLILAEDDLPRAVRALGASFGLPPGDLPRKETVSVVQSQRRREG